MIYPGIQKKMYLLRVIDMMLFYFYKKEQRNVFILNIAVQLNDQWPNGVVEFQKYVTATYT